MGGHVPALRGEASALRGHASALRGHASALGGEASALPGHASALTDLSPEKKTSEGSEGADRAEVALKKRRGGAEARRPRRGRGACSWKRAHPSPNAILEQLDLVAIRRRHGTNKAEHADLCASSAPLRLRGVSLLDASAAKAAAAREAGRQERGTRPSCIPAFLRGSSL